MGTLHRDSVQINSFSRTSTPCSTMQPSPAYYDTLHAQPQLTGHTEPLSGPYNNSNVSQYFSTFQ